MKFNLKTQNGSHVLTFNMTFLRLVQNYTGKDLQAFINLALDAVTQIDQASNTLLALGNLSESMIQIVRAGWEATKRASGDSEPVSELEAENMLNSIGDSAVDQMAQWGGILSEMMQSLFPQELGIGEQKKSEVKPLKSGSRKSSTKPSVNSK